MKTRETIENVSKYYSTDTLPKKRAERIYMYSKKRGIHDVLSFLKKNFKGSPEYHKNEQQLKIYIDDFFNTETKKDEYFSATSVPEVEELFKLPHFSINTKNYSSAIITWIGLETQKELRERLALVERLNSHHTKQLLKMRYNWNFEPWEKAVIYDILSRREHVPNSLERKKIRQEKAKFQRS